MNKREQKMVSVLLESDEFWPQYVVKKYDPSQCSSLPTMLPERLLKRLERVNREFEHIQRQVGEYYKKAQEPRIKAKDESTKKLLENMQKQYDELGYVCTHRDVCRVGNTLVCGDCGIIIKGIT